MADPLSVAGLAAGVVSLGLQVSGGITGYLDALDCREQDIFSARQENESLRQLIPVIEAALHPLRSDHQTAAAAAQACLDSCKASLKALQDLVTELTGRGQANSGKRSKVASHGRRLLYPFKRPKLQQLEGKLRSTNTALQLALQALGLAVTVKHSTTLEPMLASHATSHAADLLRVQSELSTIRAPLKGIETALAGVQERFESLGHGLDARLQKLETVVAATTELLADNQIITRGPPEVTPQVAASRLLARPAACREICDAANLGADLSCLAFAPTHACESSQSNNTPASFIGQSLGCSCLSRKVFQRKDRVWAFLIISSETDTEQHAVGCPMAAMPWTSRTQKIAVTYTGLRRLLNAAVHVSLSMRSGAGGWSISPDFAYYPTVDASTAPAFRMVSILRSAISHLDADVRRDRQALHDWQKLVALVLTRITRLFQTGKASPLAVDFENQSLTHHLAEILHLMSWEIPSINGTYEECVSPLLNAMRCLVQYKVPATDYDLYGRSPLGIMLGEYWNWEHLQRATSEYILFTNSETTPAYLPEYKYHWLDGESALHGLHCLNSQPVAQALGCGRLSLAVIANDVAQVKHILQHQPAALHERNLLGHSPLHLAADKPQCLRLLAQAADGKVLNGTDIYGATALETALRLGVVDCPGIRGIRKRTRCRRCACAECPVILLKADCAVPIRSFHALLHATSSRGTSSRCKGRAFLALRDRRDRLKQLALGHLTPAESDRLGLLSDAVLDFYAPQVARLLTRRGVFVPHALRVSVQLGTTAEDTSVYREVNDPSDADLFFRLGFRDTSAWVNENCAKIWRSELPYIDWLHNHGLDALSARIGSLRNGHGISTAHSTCFAVGRFISDCFVKKLLSRAVASPNGEWHEKLHAVLLRPDLTDGCRCRCSIEGCTPLIYLLAGICCIFPPNTRQNVFRFSFFLHAFGRRLSVAHHLASLRFLTFAALGIPHACSAPWAHLCSAPPGHADLHWHPVPDLDGEEVHDAHAYELEVLEFLLEEFQSQITAIVQDSCRGLDDLLAFWEETWRPRVLKVRQHLDGNNLADSERKRAEEIGVVWDPPAPPPAPSEARKPRCVERGPLTAWVQALDEVESGCQ